MTSAPADYPEVVVTGPGRKAAVPSWLRPFRHRVMEIEQLPGLSALPHVTVVRASRLGTIMKEKDLLFWLSSRLEQAKTPGKLVFVFEKDKDPYGVEELTSLFRVFHRTADVEVAHGAGEAASAVREAIAKLLAAWEPRPQSFVDPDPLGKVKGVIAATADLRTSSGRLSAEQVAGAFGLSVAALAQLLGRQRGTVSKTPDAEALQAPLRPFERIARLRAALKPEEFRRWLNLPNAQLEDHAPLEIIRSGRVAVVAGLVEDMLTGRPT